MVLYNTQFTLSGMPHYLEDHTTNLKKHQLEDFSHKIKALTEASHYELYKPCLGTMVFPHPFPAAACLFWTLSLKASFTLVDRISIDESLKLYKL